MQMFSRSWGPPFQHQHFCQSITLQLSSAEAVLLKEGPCSLGSPRALAVSPSPPFSIYPFHPPFLPPSQSLGRSGTAERVVLGEPGVDKELLQASFCSPWRGMYHCNF